MKIRATTTPDSFSLGAVVSNPARHAPPRILCTAPALARHAGQPWLRAEIATLLGLPLPAPKPRPEAGAIPAEVMARHTLIVGASGEGKSHLAEHLTAQHLRAGHSLVVLDPKAQAITRLLRRAHELGVPPERITVLSPRVAAVPGFNPLRADLPLAQAAGDLVAVLAQSTTSWGPRLADVLTNALIVIGAHGLSLYELARFLQTEEYRTQLLRLPPPGPQSVAFTEAQTYFQDEFAAWSKSERTSAVAPVLNKFRELLRSDFLRALLCARRQTLDLAALWLRPGLVLVHLDRSSLGEDGARLLGGLIAQLLLRTALRARGRVPVLLVLDELATIEHFVGNTIGEIVTTARSQGLQLLVACQHLAQLTPALQTALLGNTALQAFFRLGPADVRLVAQTLAAGTPARVSRLAVEVAERDAKAGRGTYVQRRHAVTDGRGRPLRLSTAVWERLRWQGLLSPALDGATDLELLRGLVPGAGRLYVVAPDTGEAVEIGRYVQALKPTEFWLDGPAPLTLVVAFPKIRVRGVERFTAADAAQAWARTLQELPVQHAAVRVEGKARGVLKITTVPDPVAGEGYREFVAAAFKATGQSPAEVAATIAWRQAAVTRIIRGVIPANADRPEQGGRTAGGGLPRGSKKREIPGPPPGPRGFINERQSIADDGSLR